VDEIYDALLPQLDRNMFFSKGVFTRKVFLLMVYSTFRAIDLPLVIYVGVDNMNADLISREPAMQQPCSKAISTRKADLIARSCYPWLCCYHD
jgi:hypothetical protein